MSFDEPFTAAESALVVEARLCHLASVFMDGRPHVVPVSTVLDLNRIVFASGYTQKIANIRENPSVALCFDRYDEDWDQLQQVIVYGEAYLVESGPEWERDRALLYEKFPQYPVQAPIEEGTTTMVEVRIESVSSFGL